MISIVYYSKIRSYVNIKLKAVWDFVCSSKITDKSAESIVSILFYYIFYGETYITIDISLNFKLDSL
jgi:hypothetical protein